MTGRTGSCLCGNIRYVIRGEPASVAICHCRDCQKQSGSAFSIIAAIPASAYEQTGTTRTFASTGDSGEAVYRDFCGTCGAPIVSRLATHPNLILVKLGTLDGVKDLEPQVEVYTHRAFAALPPLAPARFPGPPEAPAS